MRSRLRPSEMLLIIVLSLGIVSPSVPGRAQTSPMEYLPGGFWLEGNHGSCFEIDGEGTLDFAELVSRFPGVPDAASTLTALQWQAGGYRQFGCDSPPPGRVGYVDIGVHLFATAENAAQAAEFFAESRRIASGGALRRVPGQTAITGLAGNGTEYTLYVVDNEILFRITGVAPVGDPAPDVAQLGDGILERTRQRPGREIVQLYRSPNFGFFFFYDETRWQLTHQESRPDLDYVRMVDGGLVAQYWGFPASSPSTDACLNDFLGWLIAQDGIEGIANLWRPLEPFEFEQSGYLSGGTATSVELLVTETSPSERRYAKYASCQTLNSGLSYLITTLDVPAPIFNEGWYFSAGGWGFSDHLRGYAAAPYRRGDPYTGAGDESVVGSVKFTPYFICDTRAVYFLVESERIATQLIDPARFQIVNDSGTVLQSTIEWLYPEANDSNRLALKTDDLAMLRVLILDQLATSYHSVEYRSDDGSIHTIYSRGGPCGGSGVASPIIVEME